MASQHYGTEHPAAILLGGAENVAAARSLLAHEVEVVVVDRQLAPAHHVRGVTAQRLGRSLGGDAVGEWLNGPGGRWEGAVVLPLSDVALLHVAPRHAELSERFRLAAMDPEVVMAMLDKQRTAELAAEAGVPVPRSWSVDGDADVERAMAEASFPVLVKAKHTFELLARLGHKFLWAHDRDELAQAIAQVQGIPGGFSVLEFVPGPDSLLTSYNALRHGGQTLGEFTKRVERRYPTNEGGATLHEMVDHAETTAIGRRFFDHVGVEGFANVELKLDQRDGHYKLIECNHRLTASTALAEAAGFPIVWGIYRQAMGAPESIGPARAGVWQWYPAADLASVLASRPRQVGSWLSAARLRPVLPYFSPRDPRPSMRHLLNTVRSLVKRSLTRVRR